MARGEQLQRQWRLLHTLQTRGIGVPLRDLADELEVGERTVQRDLTMLADAGFPVEFEEDEVGKRYWKLPPNYIRSAELHIGLTEALSLHLAEHLFAPLTGTLFADGLASVVGKIRSLLPSAALDHFRGLDERIYVRRPGAVDYTAHADTVHVVTAGAQRNRRVRLTYRSLWRNNATYETLFDPYGLVYYDDDLFAVGHSARAGALRVLKIPRIASAALTSESFARPADFRLDDQFAASFGIIHRPGPLTRVRVRFTGPAAGLIEERMWHESQQHHWLPAPATLFPDEASAADTLIAEFELADLVEFQRWLLGFGHHAEVLSPPGLRAAIAAEFAAAARRYASPVL